MQLQVKEFQGTSGLEIYLCATPEADRDPMEEAQAMFSAVYDTVRARNVRVIKERVFVPSGKLRLYHKARKATIRPSEPASPVDWLLAGGNGALGGIQVHAVSGPTDWCPLRAGSTIVGWAFSQDGIRWATTGGLLVSEMKLPGQQARAVFEGGEAILKQAGMELKDVVRTWCYLDHILEWYGDFNLMRNKLFIQRGMLRKNDGGNVPLVPASTGMGVTPVGAGRCCVEMFAVSGANGKVERLSAAGKQRSAYEYGSAFARAAVSPTPAGRSLFVSGTAAIDEAGNTCCVGDIPGQIGMTLDCLLAVVKDAHFAPENIVQAIAYCKTQDVVDVFLKQFTQTIPCSWIVVIGDVCRDDLLFEAEVTACEAV